MKDIQAISDAIKKQLQKIDDETLQSVYGNHSLAVDYIKKEIKASQGEIKISSEEINNLAHEMQAVASMLLRERGLNKLN